MCEKCLCLIANVSRLLMLKLSVVNQYHWNEMHTFTLTWSFFPFEHLHSKYSLSHSNKKSCKTVNNFLKKHVNYFRLMQRTGSGYMNASTRVSELRPKKKNLIVSRPLLFKFWGFQKYFFIPNYFLLQFFTIYCAIICPISKYF